MASKYGKKPFIRGDIIFTRQNWLIHIAILGLFEFVVLFFINYHIYADTIDIGLEALALLIGMVYGRLLARRQRLIGAFALNIAGMVAALILFLAALPHLTYHQGQRLVQNQFGNQSVQLVKSPSRTIPVAKDASWLLLNRTYYYHMSSSSSGKQFYYTVSPSSGRIAVSSNHFNKSTKTPQ